MVTSSEPDLIVSVPLVLVTSATMEVVLDPDVETCDTWTLDSLATTAFVAFRHGARGRIRRRRLGDERGRGRHGEGAEGNRNKVKAITPPVCS